jgi:hypothetical protein
MKTFLKVCRSFILFYLHPSFQPILLQILFNVNILEDTKSTGQQINKVSKKSQLLARNDQQNRQNEQEQNKHDDKPRNTAAKDEEQDEQERNNTDTEDDQQDEQENDNTKSDDTKDDQQDTYDANSREKSNEVLRTRINNRYYII